MNAIFLYSNAPGNGRIVNKIDTIEKFLKETYSKHQIIKANDLLELEESARQACSQADVLIFAGGDGTFHRVVNAIAGEKKRPLLGYISSGTLNDFGKNFGINRNINRSLKIIRRGKVTEFDIGLINDETYFTFVSAIGTFSEISYATKRKRIKMFGKMAYYVNAVKDAIIPRSFMVEIVIDGKTYCHKVPFFLLLNSRYIGGFPVNLKNALDDGKFDVYLTKPGLFNGLLNYFLLKRRTAHYRVDSIKITPDIDMPWCIDGEEGKPGSIDVKILPKHLRILTNK